MAADNPAANNDRTAIGKPFEKGQSGNPTGRPKVPDEVKALLKANTLPAVNTLITIMSDKKAKHADRIRCAETVLDRVYGKAAQPIVGDNEFDAINIAAKRDLSKLSDEELKLLAGLVNKTTE
jgi:hypothetical protein